MPSSIRHLFLYLIIGLCSHTGIAQILHVGPNHTYQNLDNATPLARPGDTILIHEGTYDGGMHINNLQGTESQYIIIMVADGETAIFEGGSNMQFSDAAYVEINGLILQGQTGNGMNIDDGGSYDTPTHDIHIVNCIFRDMNANGNNDLLKLSGLNDFIIESCLFMNGAEGGSGIDMVGCHNGSINDNEFVNLGSNSIQAKGGTQFIRIERNMFKNGGLRNINLGGSTGLQFFRPIDAPFEAADLQVYANIFIGGWAGLAYVGSTRVDVANNTFIKPENWVFRILQETVDPNRFVSCGDNLFRNNIIYYGDIHRDVNIGPNTRPESFQMKNNLWYNFDDINYQGPDLPVMEQNSIIQEDPLFADVDNENFRLIKESPAVERGETINGLEFDFYKNPYFDPPSIGAVEGNFAVSLQELPENYSEVKIHPNPAINYITISTTQKTIQYDQLFIADAMGRIIKIINNNKFNRLRPMTIHFDLPVGKYYLMSQSSYDYKVIGQFIVTN